MNAERIFDEFPAPSYRGNQRDALADVRDAFEDGNDVVLVRAPTGSGKSLLARAIAGCARRPDEAAPSDAIGAYYTTPQVSQLDDVAADDLLDDLKIIRGKRNYTCILPGEEHTPVDRAPCARERGYDLYLLHTSYGQRTETKEHDCARQLADEIGADEDDVVAVEQGRAARAGVGGSLIEALEELLDVELAER